MRHHLFRMHEAVLRSAPIRPGDRILYLGSNSAALSAVMADQLARGAELVGVDFSFATLQRAEKLLGETQAKNMMFLRLPEPALPFPDGYFDLVIAFGAYDRLPEADRVIEELFRVLRVEGRLYWHDVTNGLETALDSVVRLLLLGRGETSAQASLGRLRRKMEGPFAIEFSRRWTHAWGKQSCLLVGRKTDWH